MLAKAGNIEETTVTVVTLERVQGMGAALHLSSRRFWDCSLLSGEERSGLSGGGAFTSGIRCGEGHLWDCKIRRFV